MRAVCPAQAIGANGIDKKKCPAYCETLNAKIPNPSFGAFVSDSDSRADEIKSDESAADAYGCAGNDITHVVNAAKDSCSC